MGFRDRLKFCFEWLKQHKKWVIIGAVVILFLSSMFGTKIALLSNFLLGKDIVVKLDANEKSFSLSHGEEGVVRFEASVFTNPFCSAVCSYEFLDISGGEVIDSSVFVMKAGSPFEKNYTLGVSRLGSGQGLYRFSMDCYSRRNALCHTSERNTSRSIMVTLNYNLSDEELLLKESLEGRLRILALTVAELDDLRQFIIASNVELQRFGKLTELGNEINLTGQELSGIVRQLQGISSLWGEQDYSKLNDMTIVAESSAGDLQKRLFAINESISGNVSLFNSLISSLEDSRETLSSLTSVVLLNESLAVEINDAIASFNEAAVSLAHKIALDEKARAVSSVALRAQNISSFVHRQTLIESISRKLELNVEYDSICSVLSYCHPYSSVSDISIQADFDLNETCSDAEALGGLYVSLNSSLKDSFESQSYPNEQGFWENISVMAENVRKNVINNYSASLPSGNLNSDVMKSLLAGKALAETVEYPDYNLTPAIFAQLASSRPVECVAASTTFANLTAISVEKIAVDINRTFFNMSFYEPSPQCCFFGECRACCVSEACRSSPETFPVILLHGHALNKDLSFEYSLDGYNKIQKRLEADGYLNAGSITVYTEPEVSFNEWGMSGVPLTLKVSYYFDLFKEPENYVLVQTKSESIETYSVRLKELIDGVKYRTGKPKVVIIANSMGGLVARRYLQIFGSGDTEKLIMIGTPNKGVQGAIADFCPITGERLECRDMNSGSLFLNKLNRGSLPDIPVYNIVGTGCIMGKEYGDGIVLEQNAWLEGAYNFVVNGTCTATKPLHTLLQDIDLYPEVYGLILQSLKD